MEIQSFNHDVDNEHIVAYIGTAYVRFPLNLPSDDTSILGPEKVFLARAELAMKELRKSYLENRWKSK